jgi:hypothetical protein
VLSGEYEIPVVISTEKNMDTCMTATGISITGRLNGRLLRIGCAHPGDILYCAGIPRVGNEVLEVLTQGSGIFTSEHVKALLDNEHVHTLIPVGSRGIAEEAHILAEESKLRIEWDEITELDLVKSAGPSTCAVFSADQTKPDMFGLDIPVQRIGVLCLESVRVQCKG